MTATIEHMFEGVAIRTIDKEGEVWFVAKDIATTLGYTNPLKAVRDHCTGVKKMDTPTAGGIQTVKIIPESDLHRLVMRSRMPSAARFQDWVYEEVLPSIRKTGSYGQPTTSDKRPTTKDQRPTFNIRQPTTNNHT